jgi:hypothetical protein
MLWLTALKHDSKFAGQYHGPIFFLNALGKLSNQSSQRTLKTSDGQVTFRLVNGFCIMVRVALRKIWVVWSVEHIYSRDLNLHI